IPVFFFLVVLFGAHDYSGPYRNVEKGLLLLYHLLTGCSMSDMEQFMPKNCIALDGGYTQFINQLLHDAPSLSDKNFCCPIRKSTGIPLTDSETLYNNMFGSFRSSIEAKFGELVSTFCKFGNGSPIRVNTLDTFVVQLQLSCLLLNIKNFVQMLNMPLRPHHSLWEQTGFDF
ncbi:hypothetical protein BC941DRAFT_326621, partial [Chlamydoabsidia padenii]